MPARTVTRAHWIRSNETARMPGAYLYVQCATRSAELRAGKVHTWRLASTSYVTRSHHDRSWRPPVDRSFRLTEGLWLYVQSLTRDGSRLVLVSHDLGVTMRAADAFGVLPRLGWELRLARLDKGAALAIWRKGRRTLVMVDALAWLPATLDELAGLAQLDRLRVPASQDDDDGWQDRCDRDVAIVRECWGRAMRWVEDADLGNWRPTASGQVFQAWRHRFMTHGILAHDDVEARSAERLAAWTGRCEAWRWGPLQGRQWVEWDYRAAYCRIGAQRAVPVALAGCTSRPTWQTWQRRAERYAQLAEVTVTTDWPCVPAQGPAGIVWPVGTFTTTLWDVEVELARRQAVTVELRRVWHYRRAPALAAVCSWILALMDDQGPTVDPLTRLVAKGWSRSLIGRFAARWPRWEAWEDAPIDDVRALRLIDLRDGRRLDCLQLGRRQMVEGDPVDAPDSAPAVTSWITAACRVDLWGAMLAAGLDNVVYVDTDSLIVNERGDERLSVAQLDGLRVKARYRDLTVLGPRQLVVNRRPRIAGVPRDAELVGANKWRSSTTQTVRGALKQGSPAGVEVRERVQLVAGVDRRRVQLDGGSTVSVQLVGG